MATEFLTVVHTNGKTVFFQFYDQAADKRFDFNDDTWQANPTTPGLSAAEQTEAGDANESLYTASTDLSDMNSTATPLVIVVQAVDDLAVDAVISTASMVVTNGTRTG